ncbi:MAG TPA: hypothetical protein VFA44_02870 [Gaiellaceae bacterium]|nr:hypothetical protein [Gaiellaceae bacterium]
MARDEDTDERLEETEHGLARIAAARGETNSNDEEEEEEDGGEPAERAAVATVPREHPSSARLDALEAEVARLRGENARLKKVAGLEARRDDPATVGDVLDAISAADEARRAEEAACWRRRCDEIAERVESRLLDAAAGLELEDELEDEDEGASRRKQPAKRSRKVRERVRLPVQLEGERYLSLRELDVLDGDEVVLDGRVIGRAVRDRHGRVTRVVALERD